MGREIKFFKTDSGRIPVADFIDGLSAKQAQKTIWAMKLIEDLEAVPGQFFKKLSNTEDIWEIRIRSGSNNFRLLGFFDGKQLLVVAHAFQKKTQKTPQQAIRLAEKRKREYFGRKT